MVAMWNSAPIDYWAAHDEEVNAEVRGFTKPLLNAAQLTARDRVLDIGCGAGETTRLAARAASSAFGLDLSDAMLERARSRAREQRVRNVRFEPGDAQMYRFEEDAFDVAISRFGVMFFADKHAAFRNIAHALGTRGRLALIAWRAPDENEWRSEVRAALSLGRALPEPPAGVPGAFSLADPNPSARMLIESGFDDVVFEAIDAPMYWGDDVEAALEFISNVGPAGRLLADLDDADKERGLESLRTMLAAHAGKNGVEVRGAAWLISARK